jgi:hypothetical protein
MRPFIISPVTLPGVRLHGPARATVPKDYFAAEPILCKKTQKLRGAAGPKRARLLAEQRKEAAKQESKLQYMEMEGSGSTGGIASKSKPIAI